MQSTQGGPSDISDGISVTTLDTKTISRFTVQPVTAAHAAASALTAASADINDLMAKSLHETKLTGNQGERRQEDDLGSVPSLPSRFSVKPVAVDQVPIPVNPPEQAAAAVAESSAFFEIGSDDLSSNSGGNGSPAATVHSSTVGKFEEKG